MGQYRTSTAHRAQGSANGFIAPAGWTIRMKDLCIYEKMQSEGRISRFTLAARVIIWNLPRLSQVLSVSGLTCLICADDLLIGQRLISTLFSPFLVKKRLRAAMYCHALCIEQQQGPAQRLFMSEFDLFSAWFAWCQPAVKYIFMQREVMYLPDVTLVLVHNPETCYFWEMQAQNASLVVRLQHPRRICISSFK